MPATRCTCSPLAKRDARLRRVQTLTHDLRASLWTRGGQASPAIEALAETGDSSGIMKDVEQCGSACSELYTIACGPEMTSVCTGSMDISVHPRRPYVSSASMLVPSPDWCASCRHTCSPPVAAGLTSAMF